MHVVARGWSSDLVRRGRESTLVYVKHKAYALRTSFSAMAYLSTSWKLMLIAICNHVGKYEMS